MISKQPIPAREALATLAGVLVALAGCGSSEPNWPRGAVKGTVTLDGKPLPQGVVRFIPLGETAGPKVSVPVMDGNFAMDNLNGPVVGHHRIEIQSTDNGGIPFDDEEAASKIRSGQLRLNVLKVPPQYNDKSTLEQDVSAEGPNEFTFELKSR